MDKAAKKLQQPVMGKKTIIARAFVKDGQEDAFIALAAPLIEAARAEEGNISYSLYQSPSQKTEFIFYEEYKDDAAMMVHRSSAHFNTFAESVQELLDQGLIIELFG